MSLPAASGGFWRSVRTLPDRTPLRAKLITAVLALVAIALAVISIAGIYVVKNDLLGQADAQLASDAQHIVGELRFTPLPASPEYLPGEAVTWVPDSGTPIKIIIPSTAVGYEPRAAAQAIPGPDIPGSLASLPSNSQHAITVAATSGGGRWRIVAIPATLNNLSTQSSTSGVVVVATTVTTVYSTVGTLVGFDLIVSAIVILGLLFVGIAVVRASLRPLTDIEQTAEGIARGDLGRRVPDRDPRTEVGRLGRSLNAMLAQIEAAFRARADSEAAARKSEERIRQFVADASHELRTPLTAIRGFAEYYRQRGGIQTGPQGPAEMCPQGPAEMGPHGPAENPDENPAEIPGRGGSLPAADLDRIMRRVEQESARMGVLVEDMLLLARLDQQRPLENRTVDLLALAADAVHDARVVAPDRSINLTVGSGAALLVLGDETRLRQVIGNLMSNALVHTPARTPVEVRIRSGSLDEGGNAEGRSAEQASTAPGTAGTGPTGTGQRSAVVLEVADQGSGLTPAQAEHVFERFYRADQARTAGGTGLGLAIVAALVAAHGGAVWVESPPAGGAVFRIALPLAPEALTPEILQIPEAVGIPEAAGVSRPTAAGPSPRG